MLKIAPLPKMKLQTSTTKWISKQPIPKLRSAHLCLLRISFVKRRVDKIVESDLVAEK